MGTLITRLSVELDDADPLKPTGGRTAAAVCWAASCVPEGGIRVSGAGMGSKYLRARFFKSMSCSRCTAAVLALLISFAHACRSFKGGTSARRNAYERAIHEGYMQDTCGIHVSARVIRIHEGYIQDT